MDSSSSNSSQGNQIKYDVFTSFRGSDTRNGFLSHLKKELHQKQIDAYVDDRLERGDEISSALLKAIEGSEISLIIFSKDYASSKWCLEELVKIMEYKGVNEQIVIPVFYNIDPSHVRNQGGTYGDAFAQHEQKFKDDIKKVQNWRSALNKAANLSGYHYSSNFENESELIDEIVKDVLEKLDDIYPYESKGLVGIEENFARIESLSDIESKEVRILGIWGMGGIGKTTLAHAIYDKFYFQFESCCFLENVREESKKINGLLYLLQKLLSVLLDRENLKMNDTVKTTSSMRRLHRKKVLIVLDDVDTSEKLKYLVGEQLCLGPGSRVIVTSRDKHVLISRGVHAIHEVKELNFLESLKLFSLNAFNQSHPKMGYEELSDRAIVYCNGIPLALKVLGSHFDSRNIDTWESALRKLQKYPIEQIQNVLRVSYDGLDDVEKDIFLDIAFFFKGKHKDDVIRVLDACGFYGACGIDSLLDKALVTISYYGKIEMHDLIQEMGEQIVREECIKDPGKRSRMKDIEEIYDVLKNNKGTEAVEGIILDTSEIKDVQLSADTFKKMTSLRFMKFYFEGTPYRKEGLCNVKLSSGLESFSDKLRYFHWDAYPLKSLPLTFCAEKLVELHMKDSNAEKLWEGVQDLVNLKRINLCQSLHLLELPDFSRAQNLEEVNLAYCESLCNVHPSILSLHSLVTLNLFCCHKLRSLQSEIHLKSLKDLTVVVDGSLKEFSLSSEGITELDLSRAHMEILGSSIGRLSKLRFLYLNGSRLRILPINDLCRLTYLQVLSLYDCGRVIDPGKLCILFDSLHSLEVLYLDGCSYVYELPDNISALSCLRILSLSESSIDRFPASIKHLSNLKEVYLRNCRMLQFVPQLPPFITYLDADNCTSLETLLTSTTTTRQQDAEKKQVFSFLNCKTLDRHSLIAEFAQFWVKRAVYNNARIDVCYPGNRVPEWFGYQQTGTTITIELAWLFDNLKDFVFCSVLPSLFRLQSVGDYSLYCQCSSEETMQSFLIRTYILSDLNSDHVILWYAQFVNKDLLEEVKRRRNDEGITYNPKLSFEFYIVSYSSSGKLVKHDDLIKACGVCPIYA